MPADVSITKAGKARFLGPLNALDTEIDRDVIQRFETILLQLILMWDEPSWTNHPGDPKIADIESKPGGGPEFHEGVWHVEGLSHEHIVSTGIAYLQIDDDILGGRLRFRRPYLPGEIAELKDSIPQEFGKLSLANIAGILRLGSVEPAADYIVVFPNSHQHNLECITAYRSLSSLATTPDRLIRRIVCFFLVNPEEKIVSTSDVVVLPSQILDYETACRVREAMMKECAMIKKDLNRDFYHYYNFFVNTDYGYCNPARS
eukprot:ANDGO_01173.mRNA.1 hypothetical protein H310_02734